MNIKLDGYKIFYTVAKNLSFSKAAEELFITQPAVSQAIKHLEDSLEMKLFLRGKKGIALTAEGEVLFEYVKNALSLLEKAENEMQRMKKLEQGELRIGVSDTLSRYLLLPYLELFSRTYPMIRIQIVNRTSVQSLELLKQGKVDLAFVNLPLEDDAVDIRPYREVHDIFVAGSRFSFLQKGQISLEKLARYPLIFLEKSSNSRNCVENFFLSKGIQLQPDIELGSHDLVLEFARINLGISCVTREFAKEYLASGEIFQVPTTEALPTRHVGICTLKEVSLSAAGKVFLSMIEED